MIKCPNPECGYENVDGTQFCEGCGEELPQAGGAAAAPGAAASGATGDMIKCPACDNLNPPENVVCEVCGTELPQSGTGVAPASPSVPAPDVMDTLPQTSPPMTAPSAVSVPDPNAFTTASAQTTTPDVDGSGAPAGSGTATSPAATMPALTNPDPTLTTAPGALPPDFSIPGVSDTTPADAATPVVAAGPTTSGVTTPDTMAAATAPAAAPVDTTPADTATPSAGGELEPGRVKFVVEQGMTVGKQFVLGDKEVLVGREDEEDGIYPDIDLSDQDEGYVHRRHAELKFENGGLTVAHLGGANKTRLNNRPLADNDPQQVKIGDKIAFGKVVMRVQSN